MNHADSSSRPDGGVQDVHSGRWLDDEPDKPEIDDRIAAVIEDLLAGPPPTLQDRVYACWLTRHTDRSARVLRDLAAEHAEAATFVAKLEQIEQGKESTMNDDPDSRSLADAFGELPQWQQDMIAEQRATADRRGSPEVREFINRARSDPAWRHMEHRGYLNDRGAARSDRDEYDRRANEWIDADRRAPRRDVPDWQERRFDEELATAERWLDFQRRNPGFLARAHEQMPSRPPA